MRRTLQSSALALAFLGAVGLPRLALAEKAAETHTETHTTAGEPATAHEEKQPALVDVQFVEAAWIVIIFVILVVLLKQTAWKNVLAGLKARENRIRKDISDAEASRLKSEATLRDYTAQLATADAKAREILSQSAADAERIGASIRARAQAESEDIKERALKEIETARKQAIGEIYEQAATLATDIAEKIIRRSLNADDQRDLVARSLEQLQSIGKN